MLQETNIEFDQQSRMTPQETAESYDQIASHWTSDKVPVTNGIEQHERAITFLENRKDALDVGCGSSGRLVNLFLGHGFSVSGIDVSKRMIELARERSNGATFFCADICQWDFPKKYDLISAWDSIWHLAIEQQKEAIRKIADGLKENGIFIFTTGGVEVPSEHTDSFLGQKLFYGVLGIPQLLVFLHECDLRLKHFEYDQYPERHVYLILQKNGQGSGGNR